MGNENQTFARRADLDALRALAMLLGIILHAALSFFPSLWDVADCRQNPGFGIVVSAIHGFRMPLFFVMSGFFSAMLLHRRGRWALVKHRFFRVLLPLMLGMVTIVPLTNWICAVAITSSSQNSGGAPPSDAASTIWAAAEAGDTRAIETQLTNGASVDGLDEKRGWTPLLWAALANRAEAAKLLIERGAAVNAATNDGATPLHAAAFVGNEKVVATLIQNGADVNALNKRGETPLDSAAVDEGTTRYLASILKIRVNEDELGRRKAAIAEYLRDRGARAGNKSGVVDLLMRMPLFHHLWFLWFLWWLVIGLAALSALSARFPSFQLPGWAVLSAARYFWLIPLTLIPQSIMQAHEASPIFGPDTSTGLVPIPYILLYYAIFFGFGVIYFGFDDRSGRVGERWWLPLAIALLVVLPMGMTLSKGRLEPLDLGPNTQPHRVFSIFLQAAYPWLMTFGLMGLFRRFYRVESSRIRYLSDSTYWLYVAHLPLIVAAQYAVRDWPLPALMKFSLIVVIVTCFLLWTYQTLVRYTWLGRLLNGPRTRSARAGAPFVV